MRHMVKCETIAVTDKQAEDLRAAARVRLKCARSRGAKHLTFGDYFKCVRGKVPNRTDADTTCAEHRLVRVACGLRQKAHITHKAKGNVHFKKGTALAKAYPIGVRCYAPPTTTMTIEPAGTRMPGFGTHRQIIRDLYREVVMYETEYNAMNAKSRVEFEEISKARDSIPWPEYFARYREWGEGKKRVAAYGEQVQEAMAKYDAAVASREAYTSNVFSISNRFE